MTFGSIFSWGSVHCSLFTVLYSASNLDAQLLRQLGGAVTAEDVGDGRAGGAEEASHVLDHPQHRDVHLPVHVHTLPGVRQRHLQGGYVDTS